MFQVANLTLQGKSGKISARTPPGEGSGPFGPGGPSPPSLSPWGPDISPLAVRRIEPNVEPFFRSPILRSLPPEATASAKWASRMRTWLALLAFNQRSTGASAAAAKTLRQQLFDHLAMYVCQAVVAAL